jgi:D-sedoheptulose 7-phosphate isomerase
VRAALNIESRVNVMDFIDLYLEETIAAMTAFRAEPHHRQVLIDMAGSVIGAMRRGGKLLVCGNGGSAGDAQHIAGEFISRLMYDRAPLPAIALTTDTSVITATANDYGFEHVFARQVLGLGQPGDILLGISTSGTSLNVLRAFGAAREKSILCLGFTGARGGSMDEVCDLLLKAPSTMVSVIQQIHIVAAHIVCAVVERAMFPKNDLN